MTLTSKHTCMTLITSLTETAPPANSKAYSYCLEGGSTFKTRGGGNYLYRAVSLAISGSKEY